MFAIYSLLPWHDSGLKRGPFVDSIEEALAGEKTEDPNFFGVVEGDNDYELPLIATPEELGYLPFVQFDVSPQPEQPKEAKR